MMVSLGPSYCFVRTVALATVVLFMLPSSPASSMVRRMTFEEVVNEADLVFVGEVVRQEARFGPGGKMIFTDVTFEVRELVAHREGSQQPPDGTVVLSLAGGSVGGQSISVSDVPSFVTGETYVVFTRWDGRPYASPVIGSFQGSFTVITDEVTGVRYPLGPGRRLITGVEGPDLSFGARVRGMSSRRAAAATDRLYTVAPQPAGESKGSAASSRAAMLPRASTGPPVTLEVFLARVRRTLQAREGGEE